MSDRVCYIRRADRGAALKGLRMLSGHTDDSWTAGAGIDPTLIAESVSEGARWISDRLSSRNSGNSNTLGVLCLDPDGAVCSWVKPVDADASLLDAAITNGHGQYDPDALEPETHSGISERFPQLPLELNYELLDPDETSAGSRAAVMACPDIPGRLLKDELDAIGIRIECFTSIWHALASVWDPGAGNPSQSAQRIVSSDAPIGAVIAIDANDGRLIWTWSREGRLITGGTTRIQTVSADQEQAAVVRQEDIARICSDWLGWSSQLGISPSRIVLVGSPVQIQNESGDSDSTPTHRGLSPAQIGVALSNAWPDATLDLIEHSDPIGETMIKIATGQRGQDLTSLTGLSARPGRAHRSMYRWAGVALVAIACTIGLFAYQLFDHASQIKAETAQISVQRMNAINDFDPELAISQIASRDLQNRLSVLRQNQGPLEIALSKPIIEELETLSYVFGMPGIEIDTIKLNNTVVSISIRVEDIGQAEQINQSLTSIDGTNLRWRSMTPKNQGLKILVTYTARWDDSEGSS